MGILKKTATAIDIFRKDGLTGISKKFELKKHIAETQRSERKWLSENGTISDLEAHRVRKEIEGFDRQPLLSVLLPVYNVDEKWLRKCIDSVASQIYENWELCVADDRSPKPHIRRVLDEYARNDTRIKIVYRPDNGHISAASNSALEIAIGEFCVLLDNDDELSPDALFWVAKEILDRPETAMIYSDEDMVDDQGKRYSLKFKPDFSRDLLYSFNLVTHLSAYKTDILRKIDGFRIGIEGSQDYDLALRFIEQIDEQQIRHIPRILYHWRAIPGSVALSGDEKPYAHERARTAIRDHFERAGIVAEVEPTHFNVHRVRYTLQEQLPSVSLILFNRKGNDEARAERTWRGLTEYENFELVFAKHEASISTSLNEAAERSTGAILCFCDENFLPQSKTWLADLVGFAVQRKIGAAGGKLISNASLVIGGAIVLGCDELCNVAHEGFFEDEAGNLGRNQVIGNYSAVSAGCMAIRRELFLKVNGFNATRLPNAFFDADLCLRLGKLGLRIVFDPYTEMKSGEGGNTRSKPSDAERKYFSTAWKSEIDHDPFYNPNFSEADGRFKLKV